MKALIAMSGGVDSSVAALLTVRAGYDCIGCTMKLFENGDANVSREKSCCSLSDVEDARSVAHRLGMPYYVFNFTEEFRQRVIGKFVASYRAGLTPNPCIDCNRYLKFGGLFERAKVLGCDAVVTGHYARIGQKDGKYTLQKALDPEKDQSYVLYTMTQEQLQHTRFPLGELTKARTRELARENGFLNAEKPDSQDICFVPDGDYAAVIEKHTGEQAVPGNFVDRDGNVLGTHRGIIHYTVGQRRGLGVSLGDRAYVCAIDPKTNTVVLGTDADLFRREVRVREVNWIAGEPPAGEMRCAAKIRYRHREQPACLVPLGAEEALLVFDEKQRAPTPGQAAVFYDGDIVLGGGIIV